MVVDYAAIRTNVIEKLLTESETMSGILNSLSATVSDIIEQNYMEGTTAEAYFDEFQTIVSTTFTTINANVEAIANQLESICANYEKQDQEMLNG